MAIVILPHNRTRQPQTEVCASPLGFDLFTNLYNFRSHRFSRDVCGRLNLTTLESASQYSTGVAAAGIGLRGDGVTSSAAKGLRSTGDLPSRGKGYFAGFGVFTLRDLSGSDESVVFRATPTSYDQGVALDLFPSSKTIRPLLADVSWQASNDRVDSRLAVDVPWFIGMSYIDGQNLRLFSGPVGRPALELTSISGTGGVSVSITDGPLYVGGMSYTGSTASFPGVIHALGVNTHRPIHGEVIRSLAENPWQLFRRDPARVYFFPTAAGGTQVLAGLTTEADSAFALTWSKARAVGPTTEVDAVLAIARVKALAVGLLAELDEVWAAAPKKVRAAGLATEADECLALGTSHTVAAGLASETDSVLAVAPRKAIAAAFGAETDAALAPSAAKALAVGLTAEADAAPAASAVRAYEAGLGVETDTAFSVAKLKRLLVGLALEVDGSYSITGQISAAIVRIRRGLLRGLLSLSRGRR